ncbi:MAG TPA: peptide chain release factor N(5)-glutamine methyltransferase [Caulobacteraceae bacterium]|nr:peptide chain release factor N(5)-glutamine methyltransferase [Caulobacteraceae bacterium]
MTTLVSAWGQARQRLQAAGADSPAIDARLLLEAAAQVSRADILADPQRALGAAAARRLEAFVARREAREPVSQILGRRGFWNIVLKVSREVLTPRPETETLVEVALAAFAPDRAFAMLDLGVGSGAILLAILAERPGATGLGVDISGAALAVARDNAATLGLAARAAFVRGDWTAGLASGSFDLVLANPPYVATAEIARLAPEVRDHEPRLALDGGADGLGAYRRLAPEILRVLKPGAVFALEIGPGQGAAVSALLRRAGAAQVAVHPDLGGRERVVAGVRRAAPARAAKKALGNAPLNR